MWTKIFYWALCSITLGINAGTVMITDDKATFTVGDYEVRLAENICWTIREVTFRNTRLIGDHSGAFNGTVLKTWVKEKGAIDWVGTGHGHEIVESVMLLVDGKARPVENGASYSGNKFCFIKNSDLRVLKLKVTMILDDSGITEKHEYTAVQDNPDISLIYLFMHCFDVNMKQWLAQRPVEGLVNGVFKGDSRFPFKGDIEWAALYNPVAKTGVLYTIEGASGSNIHLFWDRAHDRKLYFCGSIKDIKSMKKNEQFEYATKMIGFEAGTADWKEKASAIVNPVN